MSVIFRNLQRGSSALKWRNFRASSSIKDDPFQKLCFTLDGYNKLGILHDDLLNPEYCPIVEEAVRRLPEDVKMQRTYRCIRAHQLEITHSILPKEMWTTLEDDHYYLQPYIEEVKKEFNEIANWEANH